MLLGLGARAFPSSIRTAARSSLARGWHPVQYLSICLGTLLLLLCSHSAWHAWCSFPSLQMLQVSIFSKNGMLHAPISCQQQGCSPGGLLEGGGGRPGRGKLFRPRADPPMLFVTRRPRSEDVGILCCCCICWLPPKAIAALLLL